MGNWLEFVAGLGIFLYAMQRLESALGTLGEETFRRVLLRATGSTAGSVVSGTLATAVLQSSSMVGLMVLALVGSGLLPLANAIGMIVGANLGTTVTGWLVTLLGFKLSLTAIVLPLMGVGGLVYIWGEERSRRQAVGLILFALGLLIFGLDTMKDGVAELRGSFRPQEYAHLPGIAFLLAGVVFTAIIQSSSACMLITLNALSAGLVALPDAAAIIIGADLGTTVTMVIGGLKGSDNKRRVAAAHVLFNLATAVMAYLLILPVLPPLFHWLGIHDPLYGLVAFHSLFNLLGVVLVFPFVGGLAHWLESLFRTPAPEMDRLMMDIPPEQVPIAILAVDNALRECCQLAMRVNNRVLKLPMPSATELAAEADSPSGYEQEFRALSDREGRLSAFILEVLAHANEPQKPRLLASLKLLRHIGYATKAVKDIREDLRQAGGGADRMMVRLKRDRTLMEQPRLERIAAWLAAPAEAVTPEQLRQLQRQARRDHLEFIDRIYRWIRQEAIQGETFIVLTNLSKHLLEMQKQWVSCLALLADPGSRE
ncbi:Na/Pi cotransporter family protein [Ferrimonas sediminicola]|uniref:Na/Pi cotransporter family protein n=1 Tax=Ferrimonas sediminicola TaxID=2569538 RepID=A0A4U1BCE3_9GAMM|nr:Na/Pi symporter [Ferrimonas sediminicola]TKB48683.1 Na/Pi cotransporter family protein [Ferrimonas sediminicola]